MMNNRVICCFVIIFSTNFLAMKLCNLCFLCSHIDQWPMVLFFGLSKIKRMEQINISRSAVDSLSCIWCIVIVFNQQNQNIEWLYSVMEVNFHQSTCRI